MSEIFLFLAQILSIIPLIKVLLHTKKTPFYGKSFEGYRYFFYILKITYVMATISFIFSIISKAIPGSIFADAAIYFFTYPILTLTCFVQFKPKTISEGSISDYFKTRRREMSNWKDG